MKTDWAFQLAVSAGVIAMAWSALTFDHERADRREALARVCERLSRDEGAVFDYDRWRRLAEGTLRAPDRAREVEWVADRLEGELPLDRPALEGIAWYWTALRSLDSSRPPREQLDEAYGGFLRRAVGEMEASTSHRSSDGAIGYLFNHYFGRAHARLGDASRAEGPLRRAMGKLDSIGPPGGPASPEHAFRHTRTLGTSWAMIDRESEMREVFRAEVEQYVEWGIGGFDIRILNRVLMQNHDEEHRDLLFAMAAPMMESWLDRHGEQLDQGRSWIYAGWVYETIGRPSDARRVWERANASWERITQEDPSSINLYNLACTRALTGRSDEALDALDASVEAGYRNPQHMSRDRDLRSLHGVERFEEIVERTRRHVLERTDEFVTE